MAFQLIFGESAQPNSEEIWSLFMSLQNRADVHKFVENIRMRSVGGREGVVKIHRKAVELTLEAKTSEDAETALKNYMDSLAVMIEERTIECIFDLLMSLKRFEEAVVFADYGAQLFPANGGKWEFFLWKAYARLGYVDEVAIQMKNQSKIWLRMDMSNLKKTLERFEKIGTDENWDKNSFLLIHLEMHLLANETKTVKYLRLNYDIFDKCLSKLVLQPIISKTYTQLSPSEERFLFRFLTWIGRFLLPARNPYFQLANVASLFHKESNKSSIFQLLIDSFLYSLTNEASLRKLALIDTKVCANYLAPIASLFLPMEIALLSPDFDRKTAEKIRKAILSLKCFNDFHWYCDFAMIILSCGVKFQPSLLSLAEGEQADELRRLHGVEVINTLAMVENQLIDAIAVSVVIFKEILTKKSDKVAKLYDHEDAFLESVDLLLLFDNVAFAEWKREFIQRMPRARGTKSDREFHTFTDSRFLNMSLLKCIFDSKSLTNFSLLHSHPGLCLTIARKLSFIASNLSNLTEFGSLQFTLLFDLLRSSLSAIEDVSSYHCLANNDQFCHLFIDSISKILPQLYTVPSIIQAAPMTAFLKILGLLVSSSRYSIAAVKMREPHFDCFIKNIFTIAGSSPAFIDIRGLTSIIRNVDQFPKVRQRWRNVLGVDLMTKIARSVFDNFIEIRKAFTDASSSQIGLAVNLLLVLKALMFSGQQPQLVEFSEFASTFDYSIEKAAAEMAKFLFDTSCRASQHVLLLDCDNEIPPNAKIDHVNVNICSIATVTCAQMYCRLARAYPKSIDGFVEKQRLLLLHLQTASDFISKFSSVVHDDDDEFLALSDSEKNYPLSNDSTIV